MTLSIRLDPTWANVESATEFEHFELRSCLELPQAFGHGRMESLHKGVCFPARCIGRVRTHFALKGFDAPRVTCERPEGVPWALPTWTTDNAGIVEQWGLRGDYQREGIQGALSRMGGVLTSAAGSGKTFMGARILEVFLREWKLPRPARVLWLGQTKEQVRQAEEAIGLCGPLASGVWVTPKDILDRAAINVACWQAVEMHSWELDKVDFLVCDECHASTDSLWLISRACTSAWWKLGLTATYVRTDDRELLIEASFGRKIAEIDQARVRSEGHLVSGRVEWLVIGERDDLVDQVDAEAEGDIYDALDKLRGADLDFQRTVANRVRWRYVYDLGIAKSERRNQALAAAATRHAEAGRFVLIIVGQIAQGNAIHELLPGSKMAFSKMGVKKRRDVMNRFKAGEFRILIATSLADQGLDIPRIDVVVMAAGKSGGKNGYLVEQRAARGQRTFDGKSIGLVVDTFDLGHPMLVAQAWKRHAKYRSMGFQYTLPEAVRPRRKKEMVA